MLATPAQPTILKIDFVSSENFSLFWFLEDNGDDPVRVITLEWSDNSNFSSTIYNTTGDLEFGICIKKLYQSLNLIFWKVDIEPFMNKRTCETQFNVKLPEKSYIRVVVLNSIGSSPPSLPKNMEEFIQIDSMPFMSFQNIKIVVLILAVLIVICKLKMKIFFTKPTQFY